MDKAAPVETFLALEKLKTFTHAFTLRIPEVDVLVDRDEALARLEPHHLAAAEVLGFDAFHLKRAQQVHGDGVAVVDKSTQEVIYPEVDGLISKDPSVLLGIYVADCGAVYIADPVTGAFALLHSGRKGSELNITGKAIRMMQEHFGSKPEDLVVQLSPCIRPPHYEIDFAKLIREGALEAGVLPENYHDEAFCTASQMDRYYSYRQEKGKTGRMLALFGRKPEA